MPFPDRPRPTPPRPVPAALAGVVATVLAAAPVSARAHELWLEPSGDALVLRSGHRGGAALAVDASRVRAILCLRGKPPATDVRAGAKSSPTELRVTARCDVASAFLDGGHWSLTPDGEKNLPRSQVLDAVRSWESRQFAKWIDVRVATAGAVLGDELELVPVTDLSRLHPGDKATFRVLSSGKPVAGAVLSVDHRAIGETDADGLCRLRIRSAGAESVSATLRRPPPTADGDALVLEASLTFEVAP